MQLATTIKLFSAQPLACVFMAVLFVLMGVALPAGWIPPSSVRRYLPGHEWVMAALCIAAASFFVYCLLVGVRARKKESKK